MPAKPEFRSPHGDDQPRIAIIIPILNEARTLSRTLASIAAQDYPRSLIEVMIVDGGSTDQWRDVVDSVSIPGATVTILHNPKRVTPAAVNVALQSTDAPAVLWISGHCMLAPDYVSTLAREFVRHDNVAVGGRLLVDGEGTAGTLNAMVLQSPIGTGLAPWRWDDRAGWSSTVNFALFERQTLIDIGGLDERLVRNQDNDLIRRLREYGVRFYQAQSTVQYLAPATAAGLWKRAWGNASWTVWSWKLGKPSAQWYHVAPMAALLVGLALAIASVYSTIALYILLGLTVCYAVLVVSHTVAVTVPRGPLWAIPLLPFHLAMFHITYGLGGWIALLRPVPHRPHA